MAESRMRGGGAAVSKKPASVEGNAYSDVFGGPPRFVSPSAASLANYTEIFAGLASSCSIPFLDLPPAFDGCDADLLSAGGSGFDYSEVFGSLDFGEFSSPFGEMFAVPRTAESHSGEVRITEEATSNQLATGQLDISTGLSDGGCLVGREGDWSTSNSSRSDNGSINVLQNNSIKQNEESTRSEKIHLKAAPVQNCGADGALKKLSDSISNVEEQNSSYSSKSPANYLRAEQKHLTNKYPVSENGIAKEKHYSRSSSSSKLSVDASSNDIMYVTVSDISLRTQPLGIPPPSRPPPRLSDEQLYTKPQMLSTCKSFPDEGRLFNLLAKDEDIHVHQEIVTENSSLFDAEVDACSAAAAMREAMLLAQAKLKSAKELMEKKRDISQNSKKLGPYEISKYKECKFAPVMMKQESFEEKTASIDKRNEITSGSKLTLHCEMEKVAVFDEEDERLGNDLQSAQPSESENKSEKWKTDEEYHELVSSEKYEMTEAASERERLMRKKRIRTEICEIKPSENMKDALSYEIESNTTLRKDCGIPAAGVNKESANQEAYDSNLEEVGKQREVHKLHGQGERDTSYEGDNVTSFAESGNKVSPSDNSKLHYINDNQDGNHKVEAASVTCVYGSFSNLVDINEGTEESKKEKGKSDSDKCQVENFEKKINMTNIVLEPSKGEKKLNVADTTSAQEATEVQGAHRSSISKVERIGACEFPGSENAGIQEKQCCAPNVNLIERKIEVNEQEKREEIHMKELCKSIENDLPLKVDELMEQKSIIEALACEEQLKLKVEEVDCGQDCNGNETKETQLEPQQRDKNEDNTPESCNFETIVAQKMYEQDLHQCKNEGIIEIQVEPRFMDKIISINAVPVACIRPLGMTLDVQPANLAGKVDDDMSTVVTKNSMTGSQKIISDIRKEEEYEKERMAREGQTEKWDKRLEEEKEKERPQVKEKEKTRLLEEKKQMQRKLKEDMERARLLEEKTEEGELEEATEQTKLVDQQGRERKSKEEKDQVIILEELKEQDRKLEKEKQQEKLLREAKEDEKKAEMKHARILEETKNKERKLPEDKDEERFPANAKENKQKLEDGKTRLETEETKDRERIFGQEKKLTRLPDEEKERWREREKGRAAVERAIREAHERAFAEARERAERIAAERATSEAWQRASKEVQATGDKATSEILEKSSTDKASNEARLSAERAAVERATAEARERAVERALAEKAAADAREHAERHNAASRDRMRKNDDTEEQLKSRDKVRRQLQDGPCDAQMRSTGSLSSYQPNLDSNDQCEDESVFRCKARLERHQRIADRAAKALAEKNIRDILAQREQAERNRLAEHLDSDINRWSNGKEGNLRALLSTLQYILGPESGWKPIPLTDVITASAVKKAYRKATLCVHPDKLQQRRGTIQQKYICEKVFDLLKEAWNRFISEER